MLQAVIFDLDGVIVDSHPAHLQAWKKLFCSIGTNVSDRDLLRVMEGQKREDILRHFLGDLTPEQIQAYGAKKDVIFRGLKAPLAAVGGVLEFLDGLQAAGLPLALASSASRSRAIHTLEQLDLKQRFTVLVTGDDVKKGKPDPSVFLLAAGGLRVEPANILVCEDAVSGVKAAKAAGMKCLAIAASGRGPLLAQAGADSVVPDFSAARLTDLQHLFAPQA